MDRFLTTLAVLGGPFFLQSTWETTVLTALQGRQMVFFSVMHVWPRPAIFLFLASALAYGLLVIIAAVVGTARLIARTMWVHSGVVLGLSGGAAPWGKGRSVLVVIVLVHFAIVATYGWWA
jgi:hypothetical protein